ncbi:MAG: TCP-1/cpn60 chaperonin family protein [Candidatus Caenarcaniphilales bacterium]|jgi:chaperonin GroEL (HSP60 family)|nr:TCP-1/cpn60 chaperonin family protein [Candidatus Caenarcaniphilales bacterium]
MQLQSNQQLEILKSNLAAIKSIVAILRSTIGPKGLNVMLVDNLGHTICTNDGIEILNNIPIKHPVVKLLIEACQAQENQVGDGSTSTAILIESIIENSINAIESGAKVQEIINGLKTIENHLIDYLKSQAQKFDDQKLYSLINISARDEKDISDLVFKICKTKKRRCSIMGILNKESQILEGLILRKKPHHHFNLKLANSQILILDGSFEADPMSSEAASTDQGVIRYDNNVKTILRQAQVLAKANIKAVFTSGSMMPQAEEIFAKENVFVLTHVKKSDLDDLLYISNARFVSRNTCLYGEIDNIKNYCGNINSLAYNSEASGFQIIGVNEFYTAVIGAETQSILDEKVLIANDAYKAACSSIDLGFVAGEGIAELNLAEEISKSNDLITAKIVTNSLREIFLQIIDNAGLERQSSLNLVNSQVKNIGIDLDNGKAIDLIKENIVDAVSCKLSMIKIAFDVASQILKIKHIIQAK